MEMKLPTTQASFTLLKTGVDYQKKFEDVLCGYEHANLSSFSARKNIARSIMNVLKKDVLKMFVGILCFFGCEDNYLTVEKRVVDAENNIPIYFYAQATNSNAVNSWKPVFTYYIYQMEEGLYDAYFHAYCMLDDSVIWSGVQPITIEGGKKIWGEYVANGANFNPEWISNVTPMAYVSVKR